MAKKILKRSLALGALMAFVITGSAMAAQTLDRGVDHHIGVGEYVVTTDVEISGSAKPMMGYQDLGNPGSLGYVKVNVNDGKRLTVISNNRATGADTTGAVSNVIITGKGIIDIQGKGNATGLGYGAINEIEAQSIKISSDNAWAIYTGYGNTEKHTLSADTINISGAKHAVYSASGNITIKDFTLLTVNGNNDAGGLVSDSNGAIHVTGTKTVIKGTANSALAALRGSTLNVTVDDLEAIANKLGTETGPARKQGAIAADGNANINLNVKDSLTVDVKESASGKDVYGIIAGKNGQGSGTVNINAGTNDNDTAVIKINVSGNDATGIFARKCDNSAEVSSVVINGKSLTINANVNEDCTIDNSKAGYGVWVANGTSNNSNNSTNITNVTINTASTTINAKTGLVNFSEGKLDITNDLTVNSTIALETRGDAVTNINADGNGTVKMTGDIVFGYATNSGTGINADVNITLSNEESYLNGDIYKDTTQLPDGVLSRDDVSKMKLTINKGIWTPDGEVDSFVNTLDINDGVLNIKDGNVKKVEVGTADDGEGWKGSGTVNFENPDNAVAGQVVVIKDQNAKITVATSSDKLGDNIEAGLEKLATFVVNKDATGSTAADFAKGTAGSMYDEVVAEVNTDGTIGEVKKTIAAANVSVNDMAAIGLMSWRAEMNDMNKRMGELRNANGEYGVWVRMVRGEAEYNSVKNQYNQYQLGYDEKLSIDERWNVGVALSYTDAENTFAQGNGESTNKSLSIYGSKLNNDGTFIDLIAKYARLENEFTTVSGMGDAEYDTNGYSVSAEFGKRIQQGNGLWIEPQVELTYGKVGSADYVTKNGVKVVQDSMDSIIGRVGFSLGKDVKDGNVYARASYLYDFDGETNAVLNGVETLENDLGGGWWEVGFGANVNLSKATYIYADIEKTFGGEVDTNWQWNLGVRYSF